MKRKIRELMRIFIVILNKARVSIGLKRIINIYEDNWNLSAFRLNGFLLGISRPLKNYLEIGVYTGFTFELINADHKTAVDPDPRCISIFKDTSVIKLNSDDFFASLQKNEKFDVIFVDGLHEYKQAMRDTINSLNSLNQGGFILLDDIWPNSTLAAMPIDEMSKEDIIFMKENKFSWQGDVYKVVTTLINNYPDISIEILGLNQHYQAKIWPNVERDWEMPSPENLSRFNYEYKISDFSELPATWRHLVHLDC